MMLIAPDNFKGDPYGWATNQIGHAFAVGCLALVYVPAIVFFVVMGEFPPKWIVVASAAVTYLAFEIATQGWRRGDTIEDWWFVVVYGVSGTMASFTEVTPGNPVAAFDPMAALPYVALMGAHLAFGAWLRR
jgi:hypothetical protein